MEVIPAIDIRDGKCVRLTQGQYDQETVFADDPVKVAKKWQDLGATRLHIVDLDGAKNGEQINSQLLYEILHSVEIPVQCGGGIRDFMTLKSVIENGVDRAIIGTAAVTNETIITEGLSFAKEKIVISVDARDGLISLDGWTNTTTIAAVDFINKLEQLGVKRIVYTDINRDGMEAGPNFEMYENVIQKTSINIIAAGGVTSLSDVLKLRECGIEAAIIGRSLYTGQIQLEEALSL